MVGGKEKSSAKKRILLFPYAHQFGSTFPVVEMARFLKQQGHEVLVAGEGPYMKLAENVGLDTEKVYGVPYDVFRKNSDTGRYNEIFHPRYLESMLNDDQKLINKFRPDLMIHFFRFSVPVAGYITGIRTMGISGINITPWYAGHLELPRLQTEFRILKYIGGDFFISKFWRLGINLMSKKNLGYLSSYLKTRNLYSISRHRLELILGRDSTLFFDCELIFKLANNIPIPYVSLGVILNNLVDIPLRQEYILKHWKDQGRTIIFVNLGSSTNNKEGIISELLESSKSLLKAKELAFVIAGLGEELKIIEQRFQDGIIVNNIFDVGKIGQYADILVTHGGKGSLYDALAYGMFPIVIPNSPEQELNALIFKKYGLAEILYKKYIKKNFLNKLTHVMSQLVAFQQRSSIYKKQIFMQSWKIKLKKLIEAL